MVIAGPEEELIGDNKNILAKQQGNISLWVSLKIGLAVNKTLTIRKDDLG